MSVKVTERERRAAQKIGSLTFDVGTVEQRVSQIIATEVSEPYRELLQNAFVIIEGLRIGTDWEIAPAIKKAMAGWSEQTKALLEER